MSISQSDMKVIKGHEIEAQDNQAGFLNLTSPDLSNMKELAKKCPGGSVTGIETVLRKRELIIIQVYDLQSRASCQNSELK